VAPGADCHAVRQATEAMLRAEYGITHTTLQMDHAPERILRIRGRDDRDGDADGSCHLEGVG